MKRGAPLVTIALAWAMLSFVLSTTTATAAERFKVLRVDGDASLEKHLAAAGLEGYRLLAAARGFGIGGRPRSELLMEQAERPVEFAVVVAEGRLDGDAFRERMRLLGERGCRLTRDAVLVERVVGYWLPDHADDPRLNLIFQCEESFTALEYDVVVFGEGADFKNALDARRGAGYEVVGLWNSRRFLQVVLQRDVGDQEATSVPPSRWFYHAIGSAFRVALGNAGADGFRVIAADDPSTAGPPLAYLVRLMEPDGRFRYRVMNDLQAKVQKQALEKKLNKRGRNGWSITDRGSTGDTLLLSKLVDTEREFEFRVLSSRTPPGLSIAVDEAVSDGFRIVRFQVEAAETLVVVERERVDP